MKIVNVVVLQALRSFRYALRCTATNTVDSVLEPQRRLRSVGIQTNEKIQHQQLLQLALSQQDLKRVNYTYNNHQHV